MAIANLNKSEELVTNTTTASKYMPKRPIICINGNSPFKTWLYKIFKNCFLWSKSCFTMFTFRGIQQVLGSCGFQWCSFHLCAVSKKSNYIWLVLIFIKSLKTVFYEVNLVSQCSYLEVLLLSKFGSERGI